MKKVETKESSASCFASVYITDFTEHVILAFLQRYVVYFYHYLFYYYYFLKTKHFLYLQCNTSVQKNVPIFPVDFTLWPFDLVLYFHLLNCVYVCTFVHKLQWQMADAYVCVHAFS